jgi:DNA-binding NarL/FixJ family response regulator
MCANPVQDDAAEMPKLSHAPASPFTRVLLVDDHDMVREGIASLLNRAGGIEVVGSAGSGEEAVLAAESLNPEVVVMDLVLPTVNGIDATRRILDDWPLIHVIVLSACHTPEHVHRALCAGARGYVTKTSAASDLVRAIRAVIAGDRYISPGIIPIAGLGDMSRRKGSVEHLSAREREVLRLLVAGLSSAEIGRHLSLSPKSIDTYRHRLMVKLGVANRSALIRAAIEYELTSV